MLKRGLSITLLLLFVVGCAGTVRVADNGKENTQNQNSVVTKPNQ